MNEKEIRIMFDYIKVGIIIFILITCFFPFENVFADSQTYYIPYSEELIYGYSNSNESRGFKVSSENVRLVLFNSGGGNTIFYFVSDRQGEHGYRLFGGVISDTYNLDSTYNYNGTVYYLKMGGSYSTQFVNEVSGLYKVDSSGSNSLAVYYTFGEGAVGPDPQEPVINYDLLQVSYYTDIAGSGDNSAANIDNIKWSLWDLSGNYIGDKKVQIRAVPGHFVAQNKTSLLQETFVNWVRESNLEVEVFKGSASDQHKFYTWQYIAGLFSSIKTWSGRFWSIFAEDDYWFQYGWIYEIRLLDENDEPLTEWQEIVTGTASKPNNTNTIENSDNLTPELVNTIEDINTENNVTVNWYINNITINMAPEETTDKPWWSYLLDAILELIRTIADLIGNLVDSLLGLFRFTTFEIPDWETKKTTIINNTGYFGQSILFVEDLKTTVQSASYVDPVLTYPGIELDGVELIPEVSVNLNDYVNSLGLTNFRSIAYTCTDGMIYLSLLILVIKKLEELLSK